MILSVEQYHRMIDSGCSSVEEFLELEHKRLAPQQQERTRPAPLDIDSAPPGTERHLQAWTDSLLWRLTKTGAIRGYYHRPDRKPRPGEMAGLPDDLIAGTDAHRCPQCQRAVFGLELKTRTGIISPYQQGWLDAFGPLCGGVARSPEAVRQLLRRWGVEIHGGQR